MEVNDNFNSNHKNYDEIIDNKSGNHSNNGNKNDERSVIRKQSQINESTRKSLQNLIGEDNLSFINIMIKRHRAGSSRHQKLLGLRTILEELLVPTNKCCPVGIIRFQDAYDLYRSFGNKSTKKEFRDEILSPDGLGVIIHGFNNTRWILLNSEKIDLAALLTTMHFKKDENEQHLPISFVQSAFRSIETEFDKWIAKLLLCTGKSRQEVIDFGFKPDRVVPLIRGMKQKLIEWESTVEESKSITHDGYVSKKAKLEEKIKKKERKLQLVAGTWTEARVGDLQESILMTKETLRNVNTKILRPGKKEKRQYNTAVLRTAGRLASERRIKRRQKGGGRKQEIDSEEEEWLVKCIEDKTTIHGRRHESVLYTNHRVKSRDLLRIANYKRIEKGKKLLRSVSSVTNRARPTNKRSAQAKRHLGKGLWCSKKPPKTEDNQNECTHHQRKHVQLAKEEFFSSLLEKKSLCISIDDKAFLRPGTSEGAKGARNQKIIQPSDNARARQLPIHDFPESKMYITPSAFRFIRKQRDTVDDKVTLLTTEDQSIVVVHPKAYVNTTCTTWASNIIRLRCDFPDLFEAESSSLSKAFRKACARLKASCFYYNDTITDEDILAVTENASCEHREYEVVRLSNLKRYIYEFSNAAEELNLQEKQYIDTVIKEIGNGTKVKIQALEGVIEHAFGDELMYSIKALSTNLELILTHLKGIYLPYMYTHIIELTDAGPGVGVSHAEVRLRILEVARIHGLEKVVRIHRAREDSGQNEAERLNACVGDALCDGGCLNWKIHGPYDGLTNEQIETMTHAELESRTELMTEKNAWAVAKEVCLRIDDSPAPRGYTSAIIVEKEPSLFFYNMKFMRMYLEAAETKKSSVPGFGYFKKLEDFANTHCEKGELYFEYRLSSFQEQSILCGFCQKNSIGDSPLATRRPYPDYTRLPEYHYKSWEDTPTESRTPDDFQPRARIKELFESGDLDLNNIQAIKEFARTYIVNEKLVSEYLQHIAGIKLRKEKRLQMEREKRQIRSAKKYEDYDWKTIYETDKIASLLVSELNLYLNHFGIVHGIYKADKVRIIKAHIGRRVFEQIEQEQQGPHEPQVQSDHDVEMMEDDENDNGNEDNVCGQSDSSSDEEVINSIVGYSSSDSDFENILVQPANEPSSRYGRRRKDYRKEGCISWDNIHFN